MPSAAYVNFGDDIPGSVQVQDREDTVEVFAFEHEVHMPVDPRDGSLTGTRTHSAVKMLKAVDKATPMLYQFLCTGQSIEEVTINWYKIADTGQEEIYFTHKLEGVRIVSVKPDMSNLLDPANEKYPHLEWVEVRYQRITWTFLDGNIEASDSWQER